MKIFYGIILAFLGLLSLYLSFSSFNIFKLSPVWFLPTGVFFSILGLWILRLSFYVFKGKSRKGLSTDIIERLKEMLSKYPQVIYEEKDNGLSVPSNNENGFAVQILDRNSTGEYMVLGYIWHEHFTKDEEAINCFMSCLTKNVRLKVISRGKKDIGALCEIFRDNEWHGVGFTGLFYLNFFQRKQERFLQNDLISR